jgi:hypothetical protein
MLPPNYYGPGSVWDDMRKKQAAATAAANKWYSDKKDDYIKLLRKEAADARNNKPAPPAAPATSPPSKGPPPAWLVKLGRGAGEVLYWIFLGAMVFEALSRFFRFLGRLVGLT